MDGTLCARYGVAGPAIRIKKEFEVRYYSDRGVYLTEGRKM